MKKLCQVLLTFTLFAAAPVLAATDMSKPLVIRVVNFKACVEKSKIGKQEQAAFEGLKKQMESILEEKEKGLNEMAEKLNDPDYLDSLSADAETDLKRKFRALNQEITQQQNQYYQTLNQTNVKVVQKLTELVNKASSEIAKRENIDLVLTEEATLYFRDNIDISDKVITYMDDLYEKEPKDKKTLDFKLPS